jgi:alpha-amylase
MHDVIRFWLEDMGVDGFRLDAVRHLIEDGPIQQNTPATLAWLEGFHDYVHGIRPDVLTVGEVWDTTSAVVPYVDDRLDIAFEFDLAAAILQSLQWGTGEPLYQTQSTVLDLYPPEQYAAFLTNHDQDRVMSQLGGNIEAAKVAATLLLTNPGVPFIYYGEEVGMQGVSPDENRRTPMQWDSTRIYGGFTTGSPWEPLALGYRTFNVANMTGDPDSLLSHYRRLIGLRESIPVLQTGPMQLVAGTDRRVYSFLRYGEGEAVLVVVNLSGEAVEDYALYAPESALRGGLTARLLLGEGEAVAPALDALGGFAGYAPLDVLPPLSSTLILLRQEAG